MSGTTTIPNDPNPGLRAQLTASLTVLAPQLRGLQDIAAVPGISPGLLAEVQGQIAAYTSTQTLINAVLTQLNVAVTALDALYTSGYPAMPQASLTPSLYAELQGDQSDFQAALGTFATAAQITPAAKLTFSPNPNPPSQSGP